MNALMSSPAMSPRPMRYVISAAALLWIALVPSIASADVPGRVGRISYMQGDVQSYSETEPEWKVAYINEPITTRNSLFVGDGGRAEISVGSTTLAMDAGSQVDIQQLDDNTFNANVVRGRVSFRVRRFDPADAYNVAVPGAAFTLLRPGRYRIDAIEGSNGITVFAGQATAETDQNALTVDAGNAIRVALDPSDPNAPARLLAAAPISVGLDDWVAGREARFQDSQAQRYVSPNMTGYEDLDANGQWSNEADVGPVWYPTTYVQADWAPYRYGRWAYVAPWGYTWIDDAPWGFAPFHYGRWIQVGNRWGWCPGAYVARPAYAPALVGFYGGSGFSASFSIGVGPAIGWYPLAPWQRYSPQYTQRTTYINQVNNITIVNPPARFAREGGDWNREHGGTIAPQSAFASQRSISRVAVAAPAGLAARATPIEPGELPRAASVPGAARRGPENGAGIVHPEFRSPREFAQSAPARFDRQGEAGRGPAAPIAPAAAQAPRPDERGALPPNYRRLPEEQRPGSAVEAARPVAPVVPNATPVDRGVDRANLQQRVPTQPGYVREARPAESTPALPAADPQRFTPRVQPQTRNDGDAAMERTRQQPTERTFERRNDETRTPQPPQPMQRPQAVEQHVQPIEQRSERIERPAPTAPVAPVAPVARPQPAARVEPTRVEPKGEVHGPEPAGTQNR